MRIKKTSATTPTNAKVVNTYSESTTDGYSANYVNNLQPIDISSHFSSSYNVNTLKAVYYPNTKKIELTFWISQIPTSSGWTNFITINDSKYYASSSVYDVCYSTNASAGAVGIDANSNTVKGYQKALFGGTLIYYTN